VEQESGTNWGMGQYKFRLDMACYAPLSISCMKSSIFLSSEQKAVLEKHRGLVRYTEQSSDCTISVCE